MREHYASSGQELNAARLRMATLPQGAQVLSTPGLWVPLVNLHNVLVLPGWSRCKHVAEQGFSSFVYRHS